MYVYVCMYVHIYVCITYGTPSFSGLLFPCYLVTRSVGGINVAPSEDMGTKPFMNQYHQRIHFHWPPSPPHSNVEVQLFFLPEGGWRRPHSNIVPRGRGGYSQHETTSRCLWRIYPLVQHFFLALRRNMLVPVDVHDAKAWAEVLCHPILGRPPAWEFLGPSRAILSHLGAILGPYWV